MSLSTDILVPRQPRITRPTAKLVDVNNGEKAPLTFQRAAVAAAVTARLETHAAPSLPPSSPSQATLTQQESFNINEEATDQESDLPTGIPGGSKRQIVISSDDDSESSVEGGKPKKKQKSMAGM